MPPAYRFSQSREQKGVGRRDGDKEKKLQKPGAVISERSFQALRT